eukprot:GILJ01014559.1.p1 GENE.GILJ01014559.1~~GILJ01014559.1.p1  ORF type:complete len:116 (+),score=24.61 GILJ01014559.1:29-376(+)
MGPEMQSLSAMEKFGGENFNVWKFKMRMLLEEKDLWSIVDGSEAAPQDPKELEKFGKRARKALATICLCLKDNRISLVRGAASAREAWKKLEALYETKGLANKLFLRRKWKKILC